MELLGRRHPESTKRLYQLDPARELRKPIHQPSRNRSFRTLSACAAFVPEPAKHTLPQTSTEFEKGSVRFNVGSGVHIAVPGCRRQVKSRLARAPQPNTAIESKVRPNQILQLKVKKMCTNTIRDPHGRDPRLVLFRWAMRKVPPSSSLGQLSCLAHRPCKRAPKHSPM